jgi:hypothetical protein
MADEGVLSLGERESLRHDVKLVCVDQVWAEMGGDSAEGGELAKQGGEAAGKLAPGALWGDADWDSQVL